MSDASLGKLTVTLLLVFGVTAVIMLREASAQEIAELPPEILEDPLYQFLFPPPPMTHMYKMGQIALFTGAILFPYMFWDEICKVRRVIREYLFERGFYLSKREFTFMVICFMLVGLLADSLIQVLVAVGVLSVIMIVFSEPRRDEKDECAA